MDKILDIPFEIKADQLKEDGTFSGMASTFGGEPDAQNDIIEKGAFTETLKTNGYKGRGIKMLWQHDYRAPIGKWMSLEENSKGLAVVGKLTRGVKQADEAYFLMKDGALDGLSIGFGIDEDGYDIDNKTKCRRLRKINLWEISPVTFGSNANARITNVKSAVKDAKTIRELENALRESGLSINDSRYVIGLLKKESLGRTLSDPILEALKQVNAELTVYKFFNKMEA
jgi:hypothetical protein